MGRSLTGMLCFGATVPRDDDGLYPWEDETMWYEGDPDQWVASLYGATCESTWDEIRTLVPDGVNVMYASWGDDELPWYVYTQAETTDYDSGIIEFDPARLEVRPGAIALIQDIASRSGLELNPTWMFAYSFG